MTDTFTLTGRILDKSKAPVARARLVLRGHTAVARDPETNEVYAPPPRVTTNDEGYLCVALDSKQTPAEQPGVPLIVGVQYELRGVSMELLGRLVFSDTQATEGTLDIADIISEPPTADPSWSDRLALLEAEIEAGTGAVESVNAQTGVVVLDAGDVGARPDTYVPAWTEVTGKPTFATVATTGAYADLTGKPSIPDSADDVGADPAGAAAAAQSAASSDATTKANAAQAFAIQRANHTGSQPSSTISDLTETVQDILGAALVGSGVTVTYDDAAGSVTITGAGSTDLEAVRDAIGVALVGVGNIGVAVDDTANTITISTTATVNSTDAALRDRSTHTGTQAASTITGLAAVATSGTYSDLSGKPSIPATKADVGLGNVDNTSDLNKPVSTAQAAAFVGKSTKRAMAVLSTPTLSAYFNNAEMTVRYSNTVPATTSRWRLRLRNYHMADNTAVLTGASFLGLYHGEQALDSAGAPTAGFVSAPSQALTAFTLAADGSEYVSSWVTGTSDQITGGKPWLFSLGYTGGSTTNGQASSQGGCWYKIGAGSSAAYSQQAATGFGQTATCPFDVRIEYETSTERKVGLAIGDSLTFSTASAVMPLQFAYPSVYGRRTGHHLINCGFPTAKLSEWLTTSQWRWQRFDPSTTAYDFAVICLGTNDIGANETLANLKTNFLTLVGLLRGFGISEIYAGTVPPRNLSHGRLTKPAAAAATTITVDTGGLAAGAVQIGDGVTADARTTSGSPTDNGDGTYTYTITAGLTNAHRIGEVMSLAQETVRLGYNAWLRGLPGGVTAAVSFDRTLEARYDKAVMWPEFAQSDGLHMTQSGLSEMASAVPKV